VFVYLTILIYVIIPTLFLYFLLFCCFFTTCNYRCTW